MELRKLARGVVQATAMCLGPTAFGMPWKAACGLMIVALIVLLLAGGLAYVGGRGRMAGHPEAPPASPTQAPLDR